MRWEVVAGTPTDAELAALCVVLTAAAGPAPEPSSPAPRPAWNDPALRLGVTRNWRHSALPS